MATLRKGTFGEYYGSVFGESEPLTESEMKINAKYIYSFLNANGWNIKAISGMLGNIQAESTMNSGRWQNDNVGETSSGYGLVQWTPSTKYTNWCVSEGYTDPSEMDNNLKRILYELENNIQWIATNTYNMSFKEFSTSSLSVAELSKAFLLCYERPADQSESVQEYRASLGEYWFTFLSGETPTDPTNPTTKNKKSKYKFVLFNSRKRSKSWIKKH